MKEDEVVVVFVCMEQVRTVYKILVLDIGWSV